MRIFYTLERECAVVWAVMDLRKDPAWYARSRNHILLPDGPV